MVGLKGFDDIFGKSVEVIDINPEDLLPYHDHNYVEYSEEKISGLVESIKEFGLIHPVIVRTHGSDYEILAGHNRTEACKRAGIMVSCIVHVNLDDDKALAIVNETNIHQRGFEELSISNRAKIIANYRDRYKKQGWRSDLLSGVDENDEQLLSADEVVGSEYNLSKSEISRLIRINMLSDELKELLDNGDISKRVAVELSFISRPGQVIISKFFQLKDYKIKLPHAKDLRELDENNDLEFSTINKLFEKQITFDESAYINVECGLRDRLGQKVKLKEKSLTINFKDSQELIKLLNDMNMSDTANFLSSGDEVKNN